ncbi:FecR domain-containing protein [Marinomonas ostreistagni]|uniref:FecR domain-containing protein n=1 Tax=Marinomonas ostreistagni TaxID=359209 RepID=UPI001951CBB1|nr:FecR domain-containing protein [Marinomonas ostreistagni]MBM6550619.1 FecR domain-containing protein [Marinomonas ostreistagni]
MSQVTTQQREQALEDAAFWFAALQGDQVSVNERKAWQQWLADSSLHREAWAQVEQIDRQFRQLPAQESFQALQGAGRSRRQFLYGLAGLAVALPFAWTQRHTLEASLTPGTRHETAVGERRQLALKDGSQLWLNTNTLINIDQQAPTPELYLMRGELYWEAANHAQPLRLHSDYGQVDATASAFGMRLQDDSALLAMSEGQAQVLLTQLPTQVSVKRQQTLHFNQANSVLNQGVSANAQAWRDGFLVADNMRLEDFIRDLDRYHPQGWLKCSAAIANLRLVGHYPLADTRKVLNTLAFTLPIQVREITPWFTLIEENKNISHS